MMERRDYQECRICPRECGIDRYSHAGYCGCKAAVKAARAGLHDYEEPFLSGCRGSGTVFFSGCSLGCVYCQNRQISGNEPFGLQISEERLAQIFLEQQDIRKAHNINLVTGTHFIPSIVDALRSARDQGLTIPVIWNSSGYEKPEYLMQLNGLVDIFMPDLKTLDPVLGKRYMNAPDYPDRVKEAIACMAEMAGEAVFDPLPEEEVQDGNGKSPFPSGEEAYAGEQVLMRKGLVVRHLVIPGQTGDSMQVLKYLYETYGDSIWISLMSQYTPVGKYSRGQDPEYPELCRRVTDEEYDEVVDYAIRLGIENCMIQEEDVANDSFIPDFDGTGVRPTLIL